MLKKLSEEKLDEILSAGICEFAEHGLNDTCMSAVAKKAGISVGVLYKYYANKDDFFIACLNKSLGLLEEYTKETLFKPGRPIDYARSIVYALQSYSRSNPEYIRMYHAVSSANDRELSAHYAAQIEGMTSRIYTDYIRKMQECGDLRTDIEPGYFAFFFDNLLMMMQFTYCCPYYRERFRIYTGHDIDDEDECVAEQLVKFIESAFTFESDKIVHRNK